MAKVKCRIEWRIELSEPERELLESAIVGEIEHAGVPGACHGEQMNITVTKTTTRGHIGRATCGQCDTGLYQVNISADGSAVSFYPLPPFHY